MTLVTAASALIWLMTSGATTAHSAAQGPITGILVANVTDIVVTREARHPALSST